MLATLDITQASKQLGITSQQFWSAYNSGKFDKRFVSYEIKNGQRLFGINAADIPTIKIQLTDHQPTTSKITKYRKGVALMIENEPQFYFQHQTYNTNPRNAFVVGNYVNKAYILRTLLLEDTSSSIEGSREYMMRIDKALASCTQYKMVDSKEIAHMFELSKGEAIALGLNVFYKIASVKHSLKPLLNPVVMNSPMLQAIEDAAKDTAVLELLFTSRTSVTAPAAKPVVEKEVVESKKETAPAVKKLSDEDLLESTAYALLERANASADDMASAALATAAAKLYNLLNKHYS